MSLDEVIRIVQLEAEVAALTDQLLKLQEAVMEIRDQLDHGEAA